MMTALLNILLTLAPFLRDQRAQGRAALPPDRVRGWGLLGGCALAARGDLALPSGRHMLSFYTSLGGDQTPVLMFIIMRPCL